MSSFTGTKKDDNVTDQKVVGIESSNEEHKKRLWHRYTLFNTFVINVTVRFMAPGLYNTMNSLGAVELKVSFLINAANALVFGLNKLFY